MSADVIIACVKDEYSLFELRRKLSAQDPRERTRARERLRELSITHDDLTVAAVASKLSRPVRVYTPPYSGDAA